MYSSTMFPSEEACVEVLQLLREIDNIPDDNWLNLKENIYAG